MKEFSKEDLEFIKNYEKASSVYKPEDLKRTGINPPPRDGKCDCCGKHISELKPYGKAGDPLVGDFDGVLLLKRFRRDFPYNEEAERVMNEANEIVMNGEDITDQDIEVWLINKYGKEKGKEFHNYMLSCQVGPSWECRDCAVLDGDEYWKIKDRRWSQEEKCFY